MDNSPSRPISRESEAIDEGARHAKLLEAARRGEKTALAELFDLFAMDVNRVVWRLLGADPEHDDVVQEVFLAAYNGLHTVREPRALRSWLVGIAVYTVRATLRKRRWRRLWTPLVEAVHPAAGPSDPAEGEILRHTYATLARMPVDERTAFALRFIDGQALEDVALSMKCSLATAKRRLRRAQDRFLRLANQVPALREAFADAMAKKGRKP